MKHTALAAFAAISVLVLSAPAMAACYGTSTFSSCYGGGGNNYTVNRLGNSTYLNGYNANTGSIWSQRSTTLGGTTYTYGQTNGQPWNETTRSYGSMTTHSGIDSDGNSFSTICTAYGCF